MTRIKPIKRTLKARRGLMHHKDYVLASLDELKALTGAEPNIKRVHGEPNFPSGTQFGFSFFTMIQGKRTPVLLYDYQTYFPLKGPEWIHWRIDATSKTSSKKIKDYLNELIYLLRKQNNNPK